MDRLHRQNKGRKKIARTIGVSESTLSRELNHNSGKRGYHWKQAQTKAKSRQLTICGRAKSHHD